MRLDSFLIAVFLHKLPYRRSIIVRGGGLPVLTQKILNCGNLAVVAAGIPIPCAVKWQVKCKLAPEWQNGMIVAGAVALRFELGPKDRGPQEGRRYDCCVIAGCKGEERERTAVNWIAQFLAVGIAAAKDISCSFAAACKKHEQECDQCPVFHDNQSLL